MYCTMCETAGQMCPDCDRENEMLSIKEWIDNASYVELLRKWRFSKSGDPFFQGEIGEYYKEKMEEVKKSLPHSEVVAASKRVGWDG